MFVYDCCLCECCFHVCGFIGVVVVFVRLCVSCVFLLFAGLLGELCVVVLVCLCLCSLLVCVLFNVCVLVCYCLVVVCVLRLCVLYVGVFVVLLSFV